ncbi:hypothetical protein ACEV96_24470, partial [Vibrio parahaemolyticus]
TPGGGDALVAAGTSLPTAPLGSGARGSADAPGPSALDDVSDGDAAERASFFGARSPKKKKSAITASARIAIAADARFFAGAFAMNEC